MPYLGGLALFAGWLTAMFACYFITPHDPQVLELGLHHVKFPHAIVLGATVITLTGLIDDIYGISPRVKVGGQLVAAAALASQDVGTRLVSETVASFGVSVPEPIAYGLGALIIAAFVLGGCNAMNLLDGLDGLAAGVSAIAAAGFALIALYIALTMYDPSQTHPGIDLVTSPLRLVLCLALLGATVGFLVFNFNPARIFMGDAGSMLLGYLCVSTILLFAHVPGKGPTWVMAALVVFGVPIIDTSMAIVRRLAAGRDVLGADDQHLHHQALRFWLRRGLTRNAAVRRAVLGLYALAIALAGLGCSMVYLRFRYVLGVLGAIALVVLVTGVRQGRRLRAAGAASAPPLAAGLGDHAAGEP
jgi:UDP-GlcNAc:undecaprenyl-phosphate GlcNAc-1-phosphate transferase